MGNCALLMCIQLLSMEVMSDSKMESRTNNCVELATKAYDQDLDWLLIISIGHTESRFNKKAVSKDNARGMLQALPKYFCPKRGRCDYTRAGFRAWKAWSKGRNNEEALCRYNSGRSCKDSRKARRYSNTVMRKYESLIYLEEHVCEIVGC